MRQAPIHRVVDSACSRVGRATQRAGTFLSVLCLFFISVFTASIPASFEERIGYFFLFGLIPALGFYLIGYILRGMLALSCKLCGIIAPHCLRWQARFTNSLLNWARASALDLLDRCSLTLAHCRIATGQWMPILFRLDQKERRSLNRQYRHVRGVIIEFSCLLGGGPGVIRGGASRSVGGGGRGGGGRLLGGGGRAAHRRGLGPGSSFFGGGGGGGRGGRGLGWGVEWRSPCERVGGRIGAPQPAPRPRGFLWFRPFRPGAEALGRPPRVGARQMVPRTGTIEKGPHPSRSHGSHRKWEPLRAWMKNNRGGGGGGARGAGVSAEQLVWDEQATPYDLEF